MDIVKNISKKTKAGSGKLLKYQIKENEKVLMELLPTKQNQEKAHRMSFMEGIEVINIYDQ